MEERNALKKRTKEFNMDASPYGYTGATVRTVLLALNTHFCSGCNLQSTILHFGVKLILHFKQIGMFIVRDSTGAE